MATMNDDLINWVPPAEAWEPESALVSADPYFPDPYYPDPYAQR